MTAALRVFCRSVSSAVILSLGFSDETTADMVVSCVVALALMPAPSLPHTVCDISDSSKANFEMRVRRNTCRYGLLVAALQRKSDCGFGCGSGKYRVDRWLIRKVDISHTIFFRPSRMGYPCPASHAQTKRPAVFAHRGPLRRQRRSIAYAAINLENRNSPRRMPRDPANADARAVRPARYRVAPAPR